MKNYFLLGGLILLTQISFSQNITFKNFCDLRINSLAEVEEFLVAKGWTFDKSIEGNDSIMQKITYVYTTKSTSPGIKERTFINYIGNEGQFKRVSLLTFNRKLYDTILGQCKTAKFQLIETKLEGNNINKIYSNNDIIVEFYSKHIVDNNHTYEYYSIILWDKSDYAGQVGY